MSCDADCRNNCYDSCISGCVNGCSDTSRHGTDASGSNAVRTAQQANRSAGDTLPKQGAQAQAQGAAL
ncbi:MAG: hypothetical protein LBQ83_05750 [Candidatus Margulisbacteria bacterium]|nr:hypothetical protein [Candidatus Margulisiibacteriota bacterium]